MIELQALHKSYAIHGQSFHALKNIDLHIPRGKIFGILGKSGMGKSTLLRCINLLEQPTSGKVMMNGVNLSELTPAELRAQRHKIGMIFQHFNLLASRTAFENIALPLEIIGESKLAIQQRVSALLDVVDLQNRKDHYPSQLSGGQKQRVAIARALATHPTVLLCDEATSALDTESTQSILALLKKINQTFGLTILLITHELDVAKQICDDIGILDHGELLEQGQTMDILIHPKNPITKQLVKKAFHLDITGLSLPANAILLQLTFIGKDSNEPLISTLAKEFPITINIRQAQIEHINHATVGFTICELTGDAHALNDAIRYIQSTSIQVEVLARG